MLDKLKFNNLIISNAKVIQKARIQIVRKIIQKERKLKMLLEKRPGDQSSVVKLRKCVAIVDVVKKIKREDAMRSILLLLMDKNPNKIVTNSQSPPEEVAIALLAVNKTMQDLVQRFRKELNYDDAESENWKKTLIEIGKLKAKKQRRKKRREHEEQKLKKQRKSKRDNAEDETSDDKSTTVKSQKNDNLAKKTKARKLSEITKGQDVPTKKLRIAEPENTDDDDEQPPKVQRELKNKLAEKSINKSKARDISESTEDDEEEVSKVIKDSKKSKEKSTEKAKATALAESTEDDDEEGSEVTKESKKPKEKPPKKTKARDLAESTEDDDEEISEVVKDLKKKKSAEKIKARELVESTEDEGDSDDEELDKTMNSRKESQIKYLSGYRKFEVLRNKSKVSSAKKVTAPVKVGFVDPFFRTETGEPYIANIVLNTNSKGDANDADDLQKEFEIRPTKHFNNTEGRSNPKKSKLNGMESATKQEVLHPSWMAKKKLNSIVDFRGKKITFDESGSSNVQPEPKKNSIEATKTDLHPSWVAKQKMKPTISAFQGKKITFENDE